MLRLLAQRAHDDGIDVAEQLRCSLSGVMPRASGDRRDFRLAFDRPAFHGASHRAARSLRIADADRAFELELAGRRRAPCTGRSPVSNSYSTTPSAYTSLAVVTGAAENLFRARILGRQQPVVHACQRQHRGRIAGIEQLGDAEVEQLGRAFGGDQDVGRLEVAMHDQVLVRVLNRRADLQEQLQARAHVELLPIAITIERLAVDVLHDEVRLAVRVSPASSSRAMLA